MEALSATEESTTPTATGGAGNIAQQLSGLSSGASSVQNTANTPSVETATTSSTSLEGMPHLQQGLFKTVCDVKLHINHIRWNTGGIIIWHNGKRN